MTIMWLITINFFNRLTALDNIWCFINKVREEHVQIINLINTRGAQSVINPVNKIGQQTYLCSLTVLPAFGLHLLPLYHRLNFSRPNDETYFGDFFFRILRPICWPQDRSFSTRHRRRAPGFIAATSLCSTSHTLSTTPRLSLASIGVTSKLLPRHPLIIRLRQQFLWSQSGSYLSLRQTLISSDAPSSRRINKADLLFISLQSANLTPNLTRCDIKGW